MKILVTGSAGFIGFHLSTRLLADGHDVVGIDNLNSYYEVTLKEKRLEELYRQANKETTTGRFSFHKLDISEQEPVDKIFKNNEFDVVINLAAQAGVRYSLENPKAYIESNVSGFLNILESCRNSNQPHLIYASSSSVYGMNKKVPFSTADRVDHPISLYAASKRSNELMAHTYSHLFNIPTTGLRFFTVYGPWGRPDMAYYSFTQKIMRGEPITVFNNGVMKRDFTYIDDIVDGICRLICTRPQPQASEETYSPAPFKVYNIGNNKPITLERFISAIETATNKKAIRQNLPMQPGDVPETFADIDDLSSDTGFHPSTEIEKGIACFVDWYRKYQETTT